MHTQDDGSVEISSSLSIPQDELEFRFSRSGGPGGQHVNRSETRVELRFNVAESPSLSEPQRELIMARLAHLIDQGGVLHIASSESRSQHRNRRLVLARLGSLLQGALRPKKKRRPTRPSKAAVEKRLEGKRKQSDKKRSRRWR